MKGENINVYTINGSIVIESKTVRIRETISYNFIEGILIRHVNETYENQMDVFLSKPIKYENIGKHFFHKLIFFIFLLFHKNRHIIEMSYSNEDLFLILKEIKNNIPNIKIPSSLNKSLFWDEISQNHSIPMAKLVYSREGLNLIDFLRKFKILKNR